VPYVTIRMVDDGKTDEQRRRLIEGVTDVLVDVLGGRRDGVWVVLDEVPLDRWGIGGRTIAERRAGA
jgi:4-oxalocrotonate tautomerase